MIKSIEGDEWTEHKCGPLTLFKHVDDSNNKFFYYRVVDEHETLGSVLTYLEPVNEESFAERLEFYYEAAYFTPDEWEKGFEELGLKFTLVPKDREDKSKYVIKTEDGDVIISCDECVDIADILEDNICKQVYVPMKEDAYTFRFDITETCLELDSDKLVSDTEIDSDSDTEDEPQRKREREIDEIVEIVMKRVKIELGDIMHEIEGLKKELIDKIMQ